MYEDSKIGIIYPPVKEAKYDGKELYFGNKMVLSISQKFYRKSQIKLFKELFKNFTAGIINLKINVVENDMPYVLIGEQAYDQAKEVKLGTNDYAILIDDKKIQLCFSDNKSFAHAFCTLLQTIEILETKKGQEKFGVPQCEIFDEPLIKFRATHYNIGSSHKFPSVRKIIREIGFYKFSHLALEFYSGMFKSKTCKWITLKNAFTDKQIKTIIQEARDLGMDIITQINIWGHAPMYSGRSGRHVALENDPKKQPLYSKTGWEWNILNPEVKKMLKNYMSEVIDLCQPDEYFLIGGDEAVTYGYERQFYGKDSIKIVCDYINEMADWLKGKGLKTMMWGDMLLCNPEWKEVSQSALTPENAKRMCELISKDVVIVDWQYFMENVEDIPTTKHLSDCGFQTMIACWTSSKDVKICADNVYRYNYLGFMQTLWASHLTFTCLLARSSIACWSNPEKSLKEDEMKMMMVIDDYLRKLLPPKGVLKKMGSCLR